MDTDILRPLIDLRDLTIQKNRIAFSNRLNAIDLGRDKTDYRTIEILERWLLRFENLEKELDEDIKTVAGDLPIIQEMCNVKGVGFILSAKIISMIDIERASTISSLWRYAGMAVIDGQAEKLKKGEPSHYNKRLKTYCWLVATSMLRANSPYRKIYDSAREYYEVKKPDWTKLHKHRAATRKMIKIWLSHLWIKWREMEGLPITEPYVHDRLEHKSKFKSSEFGWTN